MKKNIILLAILCSSALAQAFPGTVNLSKKDGAVTRTLSMSKWSVDKRGVPSFDYRYKQIGAKCEYERQGRATAGVDADGMCQSI